MSFTSVAVIGAGNIGAGVVADLVLHGVRAVAVDLSEAALERAREEVVAKVRFAPLTLQGARKMGRSEILALTTFSTRLEDAGGCEFIIENVTEDWAVKEPLYRRLDAIAPAPVCFAANTSCIPITRLGGATLRPDRVIGLHFMNPPHLKPAVEVIRGKHTSDRTMAEAGRLLAQLDKRGIAVADRPGFVSNRISHLFMNEAALAFEEGLASAADIDTLFQQGFGHKMGPLATADLIGLDTVVRSLDELFAELGDPKYRCCLRMRQLVAEGHCGIKTGRGFHLYS